MFESFLDRSIKYPLMYIIVLTVLAPDQWRLKCGVISPQCYVFKRLFNPQKGRLPPFSTANKPNDFKINLRDLYSFHLIIS